MHALELVVTLSGRYEFEGLERLIRQLQPLFQVELPARVHINLSGVVFFGPTALALLVSTLQDLMARGLIQPGSSYVPPRNSLVRRYLARMDVEKLLVEEAPEEQFVRRIDDAFRPCQVFSTFDEAVEVSGSLASAMIEARTLDSGTKIAFWFLLQEMAQNVVMHAESQAGGVAVAQRLRQQNLFELAIADRGIGVPSSLAKNADFAGLSDLEALRAAIQPGVSGSQSEGLGLHGTRTVLRSNGGMFLLRSRSASLQSGELVDGIANLPVYPGTLVVLRVRTDQVLTVAHVLWGGVQGEDVDVGR